LALTASGSVVCCGGAVSVDVDDVAHLRVFEVIGHFQAFGGDETAGCEAGDFLAGGIFTIDGFTGDCCLEESDEFFISEGDVALGCEAVDQFGVLGYVADSGDRTDIDGYSWEILGATVVSQCVLERVAWNWVSP